MTDGLRRLVVAAALCVAPLTASAQLGEAGGTVFADGILAQGTATSDGMPSGDVEPDFDPPDEEPVMVSNDPLLSEEVGGDDPFAGLLDHLDRQGDLAPRGFAPSADTMAALDSLYLASYAHRTRALDHRQAVFAWQHRSSQIIFGVVIVIVGVGLYFSWMQFHAAARTGQELGITEIEGSAEGFRLSSPVLGVVILVLSLAFFYLYLVHVYPITEL
jgi:hypothetical protein